MASYTITTTDDQETALVYAYDHHTAMAPIGAQPKIAPDPLTQEEFLQVEVNARVFDPMIHTLARDANAALVASLATIPPEQREMAMLQIAHIVELNGGEMVEKGAPQAVPTPPSVTPPFTLPPPPPLPSPPVGKIPPDPSADRLR